MTYRIIGACRTDDDYKTVFNGLVMTFNYSNNGIIPTIDLIKSDLKNMTYTDCFMSNKEPVTNEFKSKVFNTVCELKTDDYCTLTTVLYVLGLL